MAGNSVNYIIKLIPDDSELKKKLTAGELLSKSEISKVKKALQDTISSADREAKHLGQDLQNGLNVDTSKLENALKFISGIFDELESTGNPMADWAKTGKGIYKSFDNMQHSVAALTQNVETLQGDLKTLKSSFEDFKNSYQSFRPVEFASVSTTINNVTKTSEKAVRAIAKVNTELERTGGDTSKKRKELLEVYDLLTQRGQVQSFDDFSLDQLEDEISKIDDAWDAFDRKRKDVLASYTKEEMKTISVFMAKLLQIDKIYTKKAGFSITDAFSAVGDSKDASENYAKSWEKSISETAASIKKSLEELDNDVKNSLGKSIAKALKDNASIEIELSLPDEQSFVNEINQYVARINSKELDSIKIDINDSSKVIEDQTKRAYKDRPEDTDANTTALVNQTKKRFKAVRGAMYEGQNKILNATKEWRKEMLEQLKFGRGEFEFNFGSSLVTSLNDYLQQPGNEIKVHIDTDDMAEQLGTVARNTSVGTGANATVDASSIATAVQNAIYSAFTGAPMATGESRNIDSSGAITGLEDATSDLGNTTDSFVKYLTTESLGIDGVIKALKDFANASKGTQKSKAWQDMVQWFKGKQIDVTDINKKSDDQIVSMLQKALMTPDSFGYARGVYLGEEIKDIGLPKSATRTLAENIGTAINKMFGYLDLPKDYLEQARGRYARMESYEYAAKYGRGITYLNQVRRGVNAKEIGPDTVNALLSDSYVKTLNSLVEHLNSTDKNGNRRIQNVDDADISLLTSFRDELMSLKDLPIEDAITKLNDILINRVYTALKNGETVEYHGIHEATKGLYNTLMESYSPTEHKYDTFRGRVKLKDGREKDINSPKDFVGINDEDIADIWINRDLLMNKMRGRSMSAKKGISRENERPWYYRARPTEDIDVRNANIEVATFKELSEQEESPDFAKDKKALEEIIAAATPEAREAARQKMLDGILAGKDIVKSIIAESDNIIGSATGTENDDLKAASSRLANAQGEAAKKISDYDDAITKQSIASMNLSNAQDLLKKKEDALSNLNDTVLAKRREYNEKIGQATDLLYGTDGDKKKKIAPTKGLSERLTSAQQELALADDAFEAAEKELKDAEENANKFKESLRQQKVQSLIDSGELKAILDSGEVANEKEALERLLLKFKTQIESYVTNEYYNSDANLAFNEADKQHRLAKMNRAASKANVKDLTNELNTTKQRLDSLLAERDAITVDATKTSLEREIQDLISHIEALEKEKADAIQRTSDAQKAKEEAEASRAIVQAERDEALSRVNAIATAISNKNDAEDKLQTLQIQENAINDPSKIQQLIDEINVRDEAQSKVVDAITGISATKIDTSVLDSLQESKKRQDMINQMVAELLKQSNPEQELKKMLDKVNEGGFTIGEAGKMYLKEGTNSFEHMMYKYMSGGNQQLADGKMLLTRMSMADEGISFEQNLDNMSSAAYKKINNDIQEATKNIFSSIRSAIKNAFSQIQSLNNSLPQLTGDDWSIAVGQMEQLFVQVNELDSLFEKVSQETDINPRLGAMTKSLRETFNTLFSTFNTDVVDGNESILARVKRERGTLGTERSRLEGYMSAPGEADTIAEEDAQKAQEKLRRLEAQESVYDDIIKLKLQEKQLEHEISVLEGQGTTEAQQQLRIKKEELETTRGALLDKNNVMTDAGGELYGTDVTYRSPEEKQNYAIKQASKISSMLSIAHKKAYALEKDTEGIESEIKRVKSWNLGAGRGKTELDILKSRAHDYFTHSDYFYDKTSTDRHDIDVKLSQFDVETQKVVDNLQASKDFAIWVKDKIDTIILKAQKAGLDADKQKYVDDKMANVDLKEIRHNAEVSYASSDTYAAEKAQMEQDLLNARLAADKEYERKLSEYVDKHAVVQSEIAKRAEEIRNRAIQSAQIQIEALQKAATDSGKEVDSSAIEEIRRKVYDNGEAEINRMQNEVKEAFLKSLDDKNTVHKDARDMRSKLRLEREQAYTVARQGKQVRTQALFANAGNEAVEKYIEELIDQYYLEHEDGQLSAEAKQLKKQHRKQATGDFYNSHEYQYQVNELYNHIAETEQERAAERDVVKKALWESYSDASKQIIKDFMTSIVSNKGVVSIDEKADAEFKTLFKDFLGQYGYTASGEGETDLTSRVIALLTAQQEQKEKELEAVRADIEKLKANKASAMEYGGISEKHLRNDDLYENIFALQNSKDGLVAQRNNIESGIKDAESSNDDNRIKELKKELKTLDAKLIDVQRDIDNTEVQIEERELERSDKIKTPEQRLESTKQIISRQEQRLDASEQRINALETELASATDGNDSDALKYRLDIEKSRRDSIKSRLSTLRTREENLVGKISAESGTTSTSGSSTTTSSTQGGIFGGLISEMRQIAEGIGGGFNLESADIATETTLSAIRDLLGGGPAESSYVATDVSQTGLSRNVDVSTDLKALYKSWNFKPQDLDFDTVKTKATALKQVIDTLYDEGKADTEEFINAQTELSKLLSAWRNKIGKTTNPELYGKENGKANWESYLTSGDTKIFDNLNNIELSSISQKDYLSRLKKIGVETEIKKPDTTLEVKGFEDFKTQAQELKQAIVAETAGSEEQKKLQAKLIQVLQAWAKNKESGFTKAPTSKEWAEYLVNKGVFDNVDTAITPLTNRQLNKGSNAKSGTSATPSKPKDTNKPASTQPTSQKTSSGTLPTPSERQSNMTPQGGILGAIHDLAKQSTLEKVLTAIGEIAKRNASARPGRANSAQDLLEQFRRMLESDVWEGKERVAYVDLATGSMSNSITGEKDGITTKRIDVLRDAYKTVMNLDAQVHTHADTDDPYFSKADLSQFIADFTNGIKKQILLSKNNMTVLDMTDVKDVNGLLDALTKTEHSFESLATTASQFGANYTNKSFDELLANPQQFVKMLGIQNVSTGNAHKRFTNALRTEISGVNTATNQYNKMAGAYGVAFVNEKDIQAVIDYKNAYKGLLDTYNTYKKDGTLNEAEVQTKLAEESAKVQDLGRKAKHALEQVDDLKQKVEQSGGYTDKLGQYHKLGGISNKLSTNEVMPDNLEQTMRNYLKTIGIANVENIKFSDTNQMLTGSIRTSSKSVSDIAVKYNDATKALYLYRVQEKESLSGFPAFYKGFKNKVASIMQYVASITSIYQVIGELKRGVQYVREIDLALTELKKVTDETEESYDRFLDTAAKTADKVGSTVKEIVSSTADWARLGFSMEEAAHLAESTSVLLNVSEFSSIEEATSALTSTLQAFGYTAEQSMDVVDVMNQVGNNFAISSSGIATALQDSASALMAANNSYEEAVALIAAANRVVQDPNSVGAALRTISLRLRGTSVKELEEAGEDTTGAITSTSKLRSKVKSLSGVDILTDTGAYKSTYEILLEISRVWEKMSDVDQAALLELLAGKNRANTAMAILQNTTDLEEAYVQALKSEGSALKENEKYLDSIQGKIDLFNNAVQTMWSNTLEDDLIKGVVELGTELIKLIDKIGLINTVIAGFALKNIIPIVLQAATGMGSFGESLAYIWTMMTSINGTGASLVSTIAQQTKALWTANAGANALGLSLKTAGIALRAFVSTPLGWLTIAAVVIGGIVAAVNHYNKALERQAEALKEAREEYKESEDTLKSLNEELKTTKERIEELQNLGTLTITEKDELKQLKEYNLELEKRLRLAEKANAAEQKELANEAVETFKKLPTTKESSKKQQQYADYFNSETTGIGYVSPDHWDNFFAQNGDIDGASLSYLNTVYDYLSDVYDEYVNSIDDDSLKLKFLRPGVSEEILNEMSEKEKQEIISSEWDASEVQSAIDGLRDVLADIETEAFGLISDETTGYQTLLDDMAPRYEQIMATNEKVWSNSDKEIVETYQKIEGIIQSIWNKYDPAGWFELSAQEIWNDDQFKDIYKKLPKFAQDGILSEEELRQHFDESIVNALIATCEDKGILLSDLLNDIVTETGREDGDSVVNDASITDSLSKITVLENAFNSLGDAVKEFKEDGTAAASTLESLQETFGEVDGFEELYKVLATGEGDIEEAVTNVANAYIAKSKLLSDLTDDELKIMIARLESIGVINAQELLMHRQTVQQELNDKLQGYEIDLSNYATAEEAKEAITLLTAGNVLSAVEGMEEQLSKQYGINLSDFVSTEEAKVKAAKEAAKKIAEANKAEALSALNDEYTSKGYVGNEKFRSEEYKTARQEIFDNYNSVVNSIDSISSQLSTDIGNIVDNYYNSVAKFDFSGNQTGIGRDYNEVIGDSKASDALDKIRKEYENQISLLENQQTYLENEVARMEAEEQQVGKAIYEEQIRLEEEKIDLYKKERDALLAQMNTVTKFSPEWYDYASAVWETEHAIQESTLAVIEHKQAIADLYIEAYNKIGDAYDKQQELYDKQSDYIRNNIEYAELTNQPISADYYKQLEQIQKNKQDSVNAEIESLTRQLSTGVNEAGEALSNDEIIEMAYRLHDAQLEAQEVVNEIANINDELKQLYVTAFDKVGEAFDALDSLYGDRSSYVENYIELQKLRGEPVSTESYGYLTENETSSLNANLQQLEAQRQKLRDAMANGIKEGSEEWIEMQSEIRATEAAIQDNYLALERYNEELKSLYSEAFNKVRDTFDDVGAVYDDQQAYIESYISYLETLGVAVPAEMYDKLSAIEAEKQQSNIEKLADLERALAKMEAEGYTPEDEEWVQAQADIRATEKAIWDSEVAMAEFNKRMRELETEKFEEFIKRIGDLVNELDRVYDLLSDEDVATEDGAWTEEGITSLGLMYQKMEIAKKQIADYQEEIDKLNEQYKSGSISEQEYNDRLVELKDNQWDSVEALESAKDAIVDLNEARIDMIEEGIQKEIEAYEELIQLKKDELDAERDLYEFKKNINKQTDDISSLERRIAAMSGSTDAVTVAERTKLEAELRAKREELDDTYYTHAMDSQSSALDDENEAYVTSKEDYIELLRESLEDVEAIVANTMSQVLINSDTILGELNNISGEYGITLSESLTSPWIYAAQQAEAFKNSALAQEYELYIQNGIFTGEITGQLAEMFGQGTTMAYQFSTDVYTVMEITKSQVYDATSQMTYDLVIPFETALSYAQNTFSPQTLGALQSVADKAEELVYDESANMSAPWEAGTEAANTFGEEAERIIKETAATAIAYDPSTTEALQSPAVDATSAWGLFGDKVQEVLNKLINKAEQAARDIGFDMDGIISDAQRAANAIANTGSASSGGNGSSGGSGGSVSDDDVYKTPVKYKATATVTVSGTKLTGTATDENESIARKKAQEKVATEFYKYYRNKGKDDIAIEKLWSKTWSSKVKTDVIKQYSWFAKGTLGTKRDQWAMTDEPQYGDELVLIPGKDGNLSFMRKGTSVIPADITENLMKWGQLSPNTDMPNATHGVNIMTNYVNKPEINFEFENLLHIDNCSQDSIKDVEKIVTEQLDKFTRKLNTNLRQFK